MYAGRCPWSSDEFETLIWQCPGAIRSRDAIVNLPLNHACEGGCSKEFIQFLIESWLQSVQIASKKESLPLHIACPNKLPLSVTQFLANTWPDAFCFWDHYGRLPLHVACENGCTEELIQCSPKSVRWLARSFDLLLHLAWGNKLSILPVIWSLIEAWPDTACTWHVPFTIA